MTRAISSYLFILVYYSIDEHNCVSVLYSVHFYTNPNKIIFFLKKIFIYKIIIIIKHWINSSLMGWAFYHGHCDAATA